MKKEINPYCEKEAEYSYVFYCYANANMKLVKKNQKLHNHNSPLLIGDVKDRGCCKRS